MTYLDHCPKGFRHIDIPVGISSREDCRTRLAWLYRDPDARVAANAADEALWRNLGRSMDRGVG